MEKGGWGPVDRRSEGRRRGAGVRGGEEGVEGGREVHTARAPARGGELGEGKGWTAGQTKPLLLHFCPSGQTPTLYIRARFRPALGSFIPFLLDQLPLPLPSLPRNPSSMLRRVVLSVRYFSSSLINGTVASLASSRPVEGYGRNGFRRVKPP